MGNVAARYPHTPCIFGVSRHALTFKLKPMSSLQSKKGVLSSYINKLIALLIYEMRAALRNRAITHPTRTLTLGLKVKGFR